MTHNHFYLTCFLLMTAGATNSSPQWTKLFSVSISVSLQVVLRYKLNFERCTFRDTWDCFNSDCGYRSPVVVTTISENQGEWCHLEGVMTYLVDRNAVFQLRWDQPVISSAVFVDLNVPRWFKRGSKLLQNIHHRHDNTNLSTDLHCSLSGGNWLANKNSVVSWKAVTRVDLRNRSDTNNANRSPQTTILPALR